MTGSVTNGVVGGYSIAGLVSNWVVDAHFMTRSVS